MTKKKDLKDRKKVGRRITYKPEYADQVFKYALLSLTDKEMAPLFGVSEVTLNGWKKRYPEFFKSMLKGKEIADAEVTHSLYERSVGYKYQKAVPIKVKEVTYKDGKRLKEVERVEVTIIEEVVPPDSQSMRYWLNNRRRKRVITAEGEEPDNSWAERHEVDHTTKGDKMPTPQVYMPQDLPDDIVPAAHLPVDPTTAGSV